MPEQDLPADACCAGCQQPLPAAARFCAHCGRGLSGTYHPIVPRTTRPPSGDFDALWHNVRLVAWLFGVLLASSFLFGLFMRLSHSPWLDVIQSGLDAAVILGFAFNQRAQVRPLLALPQGGRLSMLVAVLVGVGFIAAMTAYFDLLKYLGIPFVREIAAYRDAGWPVSSMFLMISVMPAVFEEIAFRGVIQSVLERTVDSREAWLIQAALFSVLHLTPLAFPSHFVMGLVFGYLRMRTRSLYPGMLLHASWNALQVLSEI